MYLNPEALASDFRFDSQQLSTRAARMHAFNEAIREQQHRRKRTRRTRRPFSSLVKRLA